MTEENTGQVAEHVEEKAAPEAAVLSEQPSRDFEKEARAAGWVPEAEFKGDKKPSVFVDAKTFVERGEELIPFIRKENKELKDRLSKTEAEFAKRLERMEKVNAKTFEAQQRAHEADMARIKREQRSAVETGDIERFDQLEAESKTLKAPEPVEVHKQAEAVDPEAVFKKANPWYGEDEDLTAYANGVSQALLAKNRDLPLEDNLAQTAAKVKAAFPHKFRAPATNGHAAVDSGGDFPNGVGKSDPLARLPAEERAKAKEDMKAFPKFYPTAEKWLATYNAK